MSTKRTSPGSSTDKQTNEDSDSFEQDEDAKRARLTSLCDTVLHDLPMELIECILVKAVAMEVMDMTRKNSEWKAAAEPVISRLTTVCSQWTSILTTNYFRNELHRTFDAEKTIRLEIVQKFRFTDSVYDVIALKDELFAAYSPPNDRYNRHYIHVYDRIDSSKVKDVIPLRGIEPQNLTVCNVSNCLYFFNKKAYCLSVSRLTKTDEHKFEIYPQICGLRRRYDTLAVTANGNLILSWQRMEEQRALIAVYDSNGQMLHETWLSSDVYSYIYKVIPKSNGNLVLVSTNDQWQTKLTEIEMNGNILREYQSSFRASEAVCQADKYGRIAIFKPFNGIVLLDSELNLLEYAGPQPDEDQLNFWGKMHYDRERNEIVNRDSCYSATIFRFTEE